jgi:hypothetical protein
MTSPGGRGKGVNSPERREDGALAGRRTGLAFAQSSSRSHPTVTSVQVRRSNRTGPRSGGKA